jgi:uncharacterized RDD family membrane protein YckC
LWPVASPNLTAVTGSGTTPPGPLPPPGWYPDPRGAQDLRWWDGVRWTEVLQSSTFVASVGETHVATGSGSFELSGWWRRAGAYVLDLLIVGAPLIALRIVVGALYGASNPVVFNSFTVGNGQNHTTLVPVAVTVVLLLVGAAASVLYAYLFLRFKSQTVGMMASGIMAVDRATGSTLGQRQALVRVGVFFALDGVWGLIGGIVGAGHPAHTTAATLQVAISAIGGIGLLVTMLWPLGSPLNQTLQDKGAGTVVVRRF